MNILYIAPFATKKYLTDNKDNNPGSIAGNIKVGNIAKGLAAQGHNVTILSSIMTTKTQLRVAPGVQEYLENNMQIKVIYPAALKVRPIGGLVNCLLVPFRVVSIYKKEKPKYCIIYNTYLFETIAAFILRSLYKINYMLEVEDLPLARKRGVFNLKPLLDRLCWNWAVRNAAAITAVNSVIYKKLPINSRKYLLPGIVSHQLIKKSLIRNAPFSKHEKTIGYFGGLIDRKGVRVLLETVKLLPADWRMIIAGGGPMSVDFEKLAAEIPNKLTFSGGWCMTNDQIYDLMCSCDVLVIPKEEISNNGEGVFPFKTFEYVVSGAHLITSKLPALDDYECEFFQRWDGVDSKSLISHIESSHAKFLSEKINRENLRREVMNKVTQDAVSKLINEIINSRR